MTTNCRDEFGDGLSTYFYNSYGFNPRGSGTSSGKYHVWGVRNNLVYAWFFNNEFVTTDFVIADINADLNDPSDFDYWAVLQISQKESIPYGNFFLIFMGLAILSIIYLYKKKGN